VNRAPSRSRFFTPELPRDPAHARKDLEQARQTIAQLKQQIQKEQARYEEIASSYNQIVSQLVAITHNNLILEHERDAWQAQAQGNTTHFEIGTGALTLSNAEISAIRKAIARLHHPDRGGDSERLKQWNAALDVLLEKP
jgi:uncharacterized protein (DUF3084 family)